jgi:Rrf2 family protein
LNINRTTRYALYAALELTKAFAEGNTTTAGQVARKYKLPETVLAKVFQQLVKAGIAIGTRGIGGGYRLASHPADTTVLDILQVFDPPRPPGQCLLTDKTEDSCHEEAECRLRRLFDEVDEQVRCTFASVTLETLAK